MPRQDSTHQPLPVRDPFRSTLRTFLSKAVALLLLCLLVGALCAAVTSLVPLSGAAYGLLVAGLFTVGIYALTRLFRGDQESDAPRPWWRMTGRPTAALLLGLFFLFNGLDPAFGGQGLLGRLQNLPYLVLAGLYLHTGVRLVRQDGWRPPRP